MGESFPQLTVSIGHQENVLDSIAYKSLLNKFVLVLTPTVRAVILLIPEPVKGEDSQKGNNRFDHP